MAQQTKNVRILALASAGGHWVQLQRMTQAFRDLDTAYASVYPAYAADVAGARYHTFDDVNRFNKFSTFKVAWQIFNILRRERPSLVVTTGAGPGLIALILAKYLFRARTIWVDSVANCEQLSSSGAAAGKVADVWLTQWEHLASQDGPQYWGSVL